MKLENAKGLIGLLFFLQPAAFFGTAGIYLSLKVIIMLMPLLLVGF